MPKLAPLFMICTRCREKKHRTAFGPNYTKYGAYDRQTRCRDCVKLCGTNSRLKYIFGITLDDYKALLDQQGGRCAICQTDDPTTGRSGVLRFSIDHDHETGMVRGLLCHKCNGVLGLADERIDVLKSAISYMLKHKQFEDQSADAVKGCK